MTFGEKVGLWEANHRKMARAIFTLLGALLGFITAWAFLK